MPRAARLRHIHDALKHVYGSGAGPAAVAPAALAPPLAPQLVLSSGDEPAAVATPTLGQHLAEAGKGSHPTAQLPQAGSGGPPAEGGPGKACEAAAGADARQSYGERRAVGLSGGLYCK